MKCPKCDIEMKWGIAIDYPTRGIVPTPLLTVRNIELIDVLKCPKCGYSDDGVDPVKLKGMVNHNERTNNQYC